MVDSIHGSLSFALLPRCTQWRAGQHLSSQAITHKLTALSTLLSHARRMLISVMKQGPYGADSVPSKTSTLRHEITLFIVHYIFHSSHSK